MKVYDISQVYCEGLCFFLVSYFKKENYEKDGFQRIVFIMGNSLEIIIYNELLQKMRLCSLEKIKFGGYNQQREEF